MVWVRVPVLAVFGSVFPCVWPCLAVFGSVFPVSGRVWPGFAVFCRIWPGFAVFCCIWPGFAVFGTVWPGFAVFGTVWPGLATTARFGYHSPVWLPQPGLATTVGLSVWRFARTAD